MKQKKIKQANFLYLVISKNIEQQINNEVLKVGDKLPSVRVVCKQHGVSMSTALQAYHELERKAFIEARPQSGYYVCNSIKKNLAIPDTSRPGASGNGEHAANMIDKVYSNVTVKNIVLFSLSVPANELLPLAKLNKGLVNASRILPGSGTEYEQIQGNEKLRRHIAKGSFAWNGRLSSDEIVTTAGCMNALFYCLMVLTQKGDTIAVESPVYFGILQLAKSLGLQVLELPTNAATGIEIDALKKAFKKGNIKACILISNFNNPLGSCMPDEHKKEVVKLLEQFNIPLIEDDIYGDVYFGTHRPKTCKTYDESGLVLWCGSVSKTIAPGYRVGWVAPGKYTEQIMHLKFLHSISSTTITQEVIADFLENGRYEYHLRKMRQTLHMNCLQYIRAITTYFPEGTKVSKPQGGFVLWIELDKRIDTIELYEIALRHKISIAPGSMFTLQKQFSNCIRLSYGLVWNERVENALKVLGKLIKGMC